MVYKAQECPFPSHFYAILIHLSHCTSSSPEVAQIIIKLIDWSISSGYKLGKYSKKLFSFLSV